MTTRDDDVIQADSVVIGAGPVGLFQVFQLGLQEIRAHVIDSLPHVGGQCVELYPDKPIYDIPAVPVCTGRELIERLAQQIAPFDPIFHLGHEVTTVERQSDGLFSVQTNQGRRFLAKTVLIAGGVGSFQTRPLKVEGLAQHEGRNFSYRLPAPEAMAQKEVVIVGGVDAALDAAVRLRQEGAPAQRPKRIVLVYRRDVFQAEAATVTAFQRLRDAGHLEFVAGQVTGIETSTEGQLTGISVTDSNGDARVVRLDVLLALQGLIPKLGPIADWGLTLDHRQLAVNTETFSTNVPGIFAVGDVNTYPGKRKLILSGFHEATLAAFATAAHLFPDRRIQLQYTTTSTKLHQLLGLPSVSHRRDH
jgi:thioredoxin reductase (NADPH)